MFFPQRKKIRIMAATLALLPVLGSSNPLHEAVKTELATNAAAVKSQKKINRLSDATRNMLEEFRATTRQTETLLTYNQYMRDLLKSQQQEKQSLQKQLQDIEITQREILPLTLNMLKNLEAFIKLDLPFLPEERKNRVDTLKQMMFRADVSDAEKFRRILEAYQVEVDYGNTIEAYRANLELNGKQNMVDFLRLGRVALYYQRLDGSETGFWDREQKRWQTLPADYRNAIRNGLRIARKEVAPDLLTVPVAAAEAVK